MRLLRRSWQRGDIPEPMKTPFRRDVLVAQQQLDLRHAFLESSSALVKRDSEALEFVRQEGTREADLETSLREGIEHGQLTRKLQRMIEDRKHCTRDETSLCRMPGSRSQENNWAGAEAAVRLKIVLDRTDMTIPELIAKFDQRHAFAIVPGRVDLLGIVRWKKVKAKFHRAGNIAFLMPPLYGRHGFFRPTPKQLRIFLSRLQLDRIVVGVPNKKRRRSAPCACAGSDFTFDRDALCPERIGKPGQIIAADGETVMMKTISRRRTWHQIDQLFTNRS